VSKDDGASWTLMNIGLNFAVSAIVRAPGSDGGLYAASNAGIFVWTNEPVSREPIEAAGNSGKTRRVSPRR
jgi:hypothetical protein